MIPELREFLRLEWGSVRHKYTPSVIMPSRNLRLSKIVDSHYPYTMNDNNTSYSIHFYNQRLCYRNMKAWENILWGGDKERVMTGDGDDLF
jgi:hypothetical protein